MVAVAIHQNFRHQKATVIGARQNRAVGTSRADGDQVAMRWLCRFAVEAEIVARFTNRPDEIGADARRVVLRQLDRADIVECFIKRLP
jgi:hypothetical protein